MRSIRISRPLMIAVMVALAALGGAVIAQIEGHEKGVPPIDSSGNYEVANIHVDIAGSSADIARQAGWREAQRLAWARLWGRTNGLPPEQAPELSDGTLDGIVAGIVVDNEEISDHRYIAQLGVLFDRARAGSLLGGVNGHVIRSVPMLVIPVEWSGGAPDSFEEQGPWQRAWAHFRTGGSPIDYVRPSGIDADTLLLNVGQAGRRGRTWWRILLDQYGAADVVVPTVYLERRWPGGPVVAHFVAYHGPDGEEIARFALSVAHDDALDKLLDEGVRRIDGAYADALRAGQLRADASLEIAPPPPPLDLAPVIAEENGEGAASLVVQVDTNDAAAVSEAETAFAGLPGVQLSIASLALGGLSTFRVSDVGGLPMLRYLLDQRGWRLDDVAGGVRLRRRTAQEAPLSPPPSLEAGVPTPTGPVKLPAKPTPATASKPVVAKPTTSKPPPAKPAAGAKPGKAAVKKAAAAPQ